MMKFSISLIFVLAALLVRGAEVPAVLKTSDYVDQNSGEITLRIRVKWADAPRKLQIATLLSARRYLPEQQRLSGPALGMNRQEDGRTFLWFYLIHPETKRDWGFYTAYQLKNGETHVITVVWQNQKLTLKADGKVLGTKTIPFPLELAPKLIIGDNGKPPSGMEILEYRIQKFRKREPLLKGSPPPAMTKVLRDSEKEFSFEIENPGQNTCLSVTPAVFEIRKGERYFLNSAAPELLPHEITASENGKLILSLPPILRSALTISATGGNLLANASFEAGMSGWKVEKENPEDSVAVTTAVSRSHGRSLQLKKSSSGGRVRAVSPEIPVEAGKSYLASGFYHWEKQDLNSALGIHLVILENGKQAVASANNRHELSFPVFPTDPGQWRLAEQTIQVPDKFRGKKLSVRMILQLDGNSGSVCWDDLDFREKPLQAKLPGKVVKSTRKGLTAAELTEYLATKKPYTAAIGIRKGLPHLLINGTPEPFVPFYAENPEMAETAVKQGATILIAKIPINNWEQPSGSIWTGPDRYDFTILDRSLSRLLSRAPDAKIIVFFYGLAYRNFAKDHPESAWVTSRGERGKRFFNNVPELAYSFLSDALRREAGKFMRKLGEHLAGSPYGKAVIGFHLTAGSDGQWYPPEHPWSMKNLDYSEGSRLAVIGEIRKQYNNDPASLRKAWKNSSITFETIRLPSLAELSSERNILDPDKGDRWLIDTVQAYHRALIGTIDHLSGEIKSGFGRPVLVLTYAPDNALMAKDSLCNTRNLDGFACLPSYLRQRAPGGAAFSVWQPHGSVRLHGKLFLEEVDFRNEYSEIADSARRRWLGMAPGVEGHFAQLRRTFGTLFASGVSGWFMTIGQTGHYAWSKPYDSIIGEVIRAAKKQLTGSGMRFPVQVLVFQDDFFQSCITYRNRLDHFLEHSKMPRGLAYSGLTFMNYLLSDLDNPNRETARIHYFPTSATLTGKQVEWIERNLQKNGNILVFTGCSGVLSGIGQEETLRRLTGMKIRVESERLVSYTCRTDEIPGKDFIGLPGNSLWLQSFKGPLFRVDDASASVIVMLEGGRLPGIAVKRHPDWTAVYIAGSAERALTVEFWRTLAKWCDMTPVGPAGDITCAGNGILMIHAATPGRKELHWKREGRVTDLASGEIIAEKVNSLTFPMRFGTTRWFAVETEF